MNVFMNFVKKSLIKRKTKDEIRILGGIKILEKIRALLLLALNYFTRH